MPVTDKTLVEKRPFDVYAMMLILSFLFVAAATWFIFDELQKNWYANEDPPGEHSVSLTELNSQRRGVGATDKPSDEIEVTETDLKEYKILTKSSDNPPQYKVYPAWLSFKEPVNTEPDADNISKVPEDVKAKLVGGFNDPGAGPADAEKNEKKGP